MLHILGPLVVASSMLIMATNASAQSYELLVGTYTQGTSEGIYRYRFDSTRGEISATPEQLVVVGNPSWLTLSADQRHLYAVNENGPGQADTVGKVSAFSIDPQTHVIDPLNEVETLGDEPTHASLSKDGRLLFVANYAVHPQPGGSAVALGIAADGSLLPVVQQERHEASHVDPERQASSHVHSVVSAPNGRFVYVSDLGADKLFIYRLNEGNPKWPLGPSSPSVVELPPGSGPRHLLFDEKNKYAYLTLEMTAQVAKFDYRSGGLDLGTITNLDRPGGPKGAGGALHLSADGRFLYVSNRGAVNELVVFAVNPETGDLREIQRRSVDGDHPREFGIDPSGQFVLIANQKSNAIVVVQRDAKTGLLGKTVQRFAIDSPSDLKFLTQ
jgi:6-phosphogluconolactonase (cycloisomerase 2 family)